MAGGEGKKKIKGVATGAASASGAAVVPAATVAAAAAAAAGTATAAAAAAQQPAGALGRSVVPSQDILEDLCARFIFNAPMEELASFERMLFLVEQAWWFYDDFYCDTMPSLRRYALRDFAGLLFGRCAALRPYAPQVDAIYDRFNAYKLGVPVNGAIVLDPSLEKCLMVKGWKNNASWGFPRGKVNKDEPDSMCAAREVFEEVGFGLQALIRERDAITVRTRDQRCTMFIVTGVPEQTPVGPRARKEISSILWHRIADLPATADAESAYKGHKFFNVWRFVAPLQRWVAAHGSLRGQVCAVATTGPAGPGAAPTAPAAAVAVPAPGLPCCGVDRLRSFALDRQTIMAAWPEA